MGRRSEYSCLMIKEPRTTHTAGQRLPRPCLCTYESNRNTHIHSLTKQRLMFACAQRCVYWITDTQSQLNIFSAEMNWLCFYAHQISKMTVFQIWYGSCKQHTPAIRSILWKMCPANSKYTIISSLVFSVRNTQPLACLQSAVCAINKPTSQQFARLW